MTTNWNLPTSVTQYAEPETEDSHVSWLEVGNFHRLRNLDGIPIKTSRDLLHIAKEPKHDLVEKTYYIKSTGFNFQNLPDAISGVEMRLSMKRHGRISDETIQLCLDNDLIGDNQASNALNPVTIYGGETDNWHAELSATTLQNPTFGVVIRFKSHPHWPHKTGASVDGVEIRIH